MSITQELETLHSQTPTQRGKEGVEEKYQQLKEAHYVEAMHMLQMSVDDSLAYAGQWKDYETYVQAVEDEFKLKVLFAVENMTSSEKVDNHILKLEILRANLCVACKNLYTAMVECKETLTHHKLYWKSQSLASTATEAEAEVAHILKPYSELTNKMESMFVNVERMYKMVADQVPSFQGVSKRMFIVENGRDEL